MTEAQDRAVNAMYECFYSLTKEEIFECLHAELMRRKGDKITEEQESYEAYKMRNSNVSYRIVNNKTQMTTTFQALYNKTTNTTHYNIDTLCSKNLLSVDEINKDRLTPIWERCSLDEAIKAVISGVTIMLP